MSFYTDKRVLVTGATGLIGIPLVQRLVREGAKVTAVGRELYSQKLLWEQLEGADRLRWDLRTWDSCRLAVLGHDMVFHLAGTKGGVSVGNRYAAHFMVPQLLMNTMLLEAARREGVERLLVCSSIGVYPGQKTGWKALVEGDAWLRPPHAMNWYQAHAKRMLELQCQSYNDSFDWDKIAICRIANTYGPFDNFNPVNAMVVPSLVARAFEAHEKGEPLVVWGDGMPLRDFVYSEDVAEALLLAMEKGADCQPVNIGSGIKHAETGVWGEKVQRLAEIVAAQFPNLAIEYDRTKPNGQAAAVMNCDYAREHLGWESSTPLEDGIAWTVKWYRENRHQLPKHYNVFEEEGSLIP